MGESSNGFVINVFSTFRITGLSLPSTEEKKGNVGKEEDGERVELKNE